MKASNDLFLLVKSLTKNEKGYFKKYASKHVINEGNNYILVFDAIDAMNSYDEKVLKLKLGPKLSKHFAPDKNYLYKLVIRSLNEYYHNNSVERELRELLNSVEILFAKGLYNQCEKLLYKAESLAEQNEKFLFQLEVMDWKIHCNINQAKVEQLEIVLKEDENKRFDVVKKYNNLSSYRLIEANLYFYLKSYGSPRTKKEVERYEKVMNDTLLKNSDEALSYWAKFIYYNIFNFYYDAIRDQKKLYNSRKKVLEFAESRPQLLKDNELRHLIALNNLLNIQDELGKDEEVNESLKKIRNIKSKSTDIQIRVFIYTYTIEFTRLILKGNFEKCIQLLPEVEEGLKKFEEKLNREYLLALRYNLFYAYFGIGDYSESLKWINKILNDKYIGLRKDVYAFVRIMYLVIHFELGNADLLSYAIQSAKRFFKKEERLFKFETIMLNFIENAATINTKNDLALAFSNLKTTLSELKSDSNESQVMEFFDFNSWIESKLRGKSFKQIIQKQ